MFENWYTRYQLDRQRRADLTREADQERLARAANHMKSSPYSQALARVGGVLVAAGQGLQARYGDDALPETHWVPTHDAPC